MANKRPGGSGRKISQPLRRPSTRRPNGPVVPLDAEDIAMARLQAHLRKAEAIRAPGRRRDALLSRTTLRLPREILQRVRERARREQVSMSEVVEAALERYLRSP